MAFAVEAIVVSCAIRWRNRHIEVAKMADEPPSPAYGLPDDVSQP